MPSLGLSYETLEAINSKLVMISISKFGRTGPYRDYKATELISFAMGGRMHTFGDPDREPLKYAGYMVQYLAGSTAAVVTMAALFGSRLQGIGQHVDISIMECLLGAVDRGTLNYAYNGELSKREGNRREKTYASGIFPCKDGHVIFAGGGARQWPRLVKMLGKPELLKDERFETHTTRQEHVQEFDEIFFAWLKEQTKEELFHMAQALRVMAGPVYRTDEMFDDPQLKAREYFVEVDHPKVGKVIYPGAPFKMLETPWQVRRSAPLLGEHNEEIYCERLGYTKEEVVRLRERGVI